MSANLYFVLFILVFELNLCLVSVIFEIAGDVSSLSPYGFLVPSNVAF